MFDHERLDVYRLSLDFVGWIHALVRPLNSTERHVRDQLLRSSLSIPLNIAEGNGKRPGADRARFIQIAIGSATECSAALDVLVVCQVVDANTVAEGKRNLSRIVAMLTRLAASVAGSREETVAYGCVDPCDPA